MIETESDFNLRSGNSIHQSLLRRRLEQISEEQRGDKKMRDASMSRFNKHFLQYKAIPPSTGYEANDVRMFVTHNPGFCYSRYGKMRSTELLPEAVPTHSFQMILKMVFTDGEVDVDKVVCLHLLVPQLISTALLERRINSSSLCAVASTSTVEEDLPTPPSLDPLELPPLLKSIFPATARYTLTELVNSSAGQPGQASTVLPSYLLASAEAWSHLASAYRGKASVGVRLHGNTQVQLLVDSILEVLQEVKSDKLAEIQLLASSQQRLAAMLVKPETREYLDSLLGNSIVSSSSSFEVCSVKLVLNSGDLLLGDEESLLRSTEGEESSRTVQLFTDSSSALVLANIIAEIKQRFFRDNLGENYNISKESATTLKANSKNISCLHDSDDANLAPGEASTIDRMFKKPAVVQQRSSGNTLKSTLHLRPAAASAVKNVFSKYSKTSGRSAKTLRRVNLASNIDSTFSAIDSDFTITSYSGFTTSKVLLPTLFDKEVETSEKEVKHINLDRQPAANEDPRVSLRTSKAKPAVNKPRKSAKRSLEYLPTMADAAKHLQDFKERLLKDDFLLKRGYNVNVFGTAFVPDVNHRQQTLPSTLPQFYQQLKRGRNSVNESVEYLQKKFLKALSPLQRMFVSRKLARLKEEDKSEGEEIAFKEYVFPVLSKQSIARIVNRFKEAERKVLFVAESQGGLGLPVCYKNNSKTRATPARDGANSVIPDPRARVLSEAKLTALDMAKLKCEIGEVEIQKKYRNFMSNPIVKY